MRETLSVWQMHPERASRVGHPAPFPLALSRRLIELYTFRDELVLDPFCGSGTTCLAAQEAGRRYVGYEILSEYVEIARARPQQLRLIG